MVGTGPQPVPTLGEKKMEWMQRSLQVEAYWEYRGTQRREHSEEGGSQKIPYKVMLSQVLKDMYLSVVKRRERLAAESTA